MSKNQYGPTIFHVNDIGCQVISNGAIIFSRGTFRMVFNPGRHPFGDKVSYTREISRVRKHMLSYGLEGMDIARITDYGYVQSLRILGVL